MDSTVLGSLKMDLKGSIRETTGELESWGSEKKTLIMSMLEDCGFMIGEETFRRMVMEFRGYEYLVTLTREEIFVILRTNET
ncbi:hypothetical protein SteCoe_25186 [Stentor coeruleus]|uniref:Uncharacterized protein n=1 Tax=Stentor coeruleus TaxID=5963 RepID=A0A1R2BFV5_9CILI|nr:hypothetical protein SteCoe_25186 [Stentor coeruleus]